MDTAAATAPRLRAVAARSRLRARYRRTNCKDRGLAISHEEAFAISLTHRR